MVKDKRTTLEILPEEDLEIRIIKERINILKRKEQITSEDIRNLYQGLSARQKKIANIRLRNYLNYKAKEDRLKLQEVEKTEKVEKERAKIRKTLFRGTKKKLCRSLQDIVAKVEDQESIFKDIDFVRGFTGCKIPARKK
jgi:hypothetical protein